MWEPPNILPRQVSRAAYGFDLRGQPVNDVSGMALRAVHDAMHLTLLEKLTSPQLETLQRATQAWLAGLNQTIPDDAPFTEAWIKSTMHNYSLEFFFLADSYARQICGDDEAYTRYLVLQMLPSSISEISQGITLTQMLKSNKVLFQHMVQLDLRVIKATPTSAVMQWYPASALTKVAPVFRDELLERLRVFIRMMLTQLPQLLKNIEPAAVYQSIPGEDITEWQVSWKIRRKLPTFAIAGVALSLVLIALALVIPQFGYIALLPALIGIAWEGYTYFRNRVAEQEKALLDQVEYNYLQNLELSAAYASLRSSSAAHERQVQDLLAVRDAVLALSTSFDQARVLDGMIEVMTDVLRFDRAMVLIRDREQNVLAFGALSHPPNDPNDLFRLNVLRVPLDETNKKPDSLVDNWVRGQSIMITDPSSYFSSRLNSMLASLEFNTFYSVPLMLGDALLGVLLVDNHFTRLAISQEDRSLVDALATNIAITMENARLYHLQDAQLSKNLEELRLMEQVDRELANTLQLDLVLELLMDWALRFTGARLAFVLLVDEVQKTSYIAAHYGCDEHLLPGGKRGYIMPLNEIGISGKAALTRQMQVVDNISSDTDYVTVLPDMKAQVSVPIMRQRRVVGVMSIETNQITGFSQEHITFIQRLATRAGVAMENARLFTETRQEQEKLSAIIASTRDGVVVVDQAGRLILVNQAVLNIFNLGNQPGSYAERSFEEVFVDTALPHFFHRVRSHTETQTENEIEHDDRTYSVSAVRVPGVGYTILLHDVTLFKEVDRLKSELVSTVSHDLKNPLSVMKGYVDLLDISQQLNPKGKNYIERITRAIFNMQGLIDDLLDLARIESGLQLKLEPLQIAPIVEDILDEQQMRAKDKDLVIEQHFAADLPQVLGDPWRVKQILTNLITNAIKYTLQGGKVTISAETQPDGFIKVKVQDTGVGIAPEDVSTIWERFGRIRNELTADEEGTGLGLVIVRTLVEAHGGVIGVDSIEKVGSTFWFTLPTVSQSVTA